MINCIICGDAKDVLRVIPGDSVDLILTSPPYGDLRTYNGFSFDVEDIAPQMYRVLKTGGVMVWIVGDVVKNYGELLQPFRQAIYFVDKTGFIMHDTMIYQKKSVVYPDKTRYYQCFEFMFILSKGHLKTFNPIADRKNEYAGQPRHWGTATYRKKDGSLVPVYDDSLIPEFSIRQNVWSYATGKGNSTKDEIAYKHPAIFPEKLAEDHIISWTNEGEVVLDPFNGAGTTTKMAKHLNRKYIGIDISKEYCDIALQRLEI